MLCDMIASIGEGDGVVRRLAVAAWACIVASSAAFGQGLDCSKARSASERAICASPQLIALDRQLGAAYADALARQPDRVAVLKQEQLAWLRTRDAVCNVPATQLGRCLSGQMTARLAQLAPAATPAAAPSAPPPQAAREPAIPSAANPPAAQATLQPAAFAAAEQTDAELRVASPGRFTVEAHSATGVALQLVDQLTGPGDVAGEAGVRDGRLDVLLDAGIYRLRAFAAKGAAGEVRLEVRPSHDAAPPQAVPAPGATVSAALGDGEQRAFWLLVPPSGEVLIEAAGRALADLRLWRNGRELTALAPTLAAIEPAPGHGLTDLRLSGKVEPGVYRAVAYGGPALPWPDGSAAMPFHLRAGLSDALAEGWTGGAIGPFGSERYRAPAFAGVFRLDLPQPAEAALRVADQSATLTRTSREPHATLSTGPGLAGVVEVRGAEGQAFTLRASAPARETVLSRPGTYLVSAVALGAGGDEAPATVLLQRTDPKQPAQIVGSNLPRLAPGSAWHGRFNLRGPTALLFQNAVGGPVTLTTAGLPLGSETAGNAQYDMPADTFILRLRPASGAQGVIDVTVGPPGTPPPLAAPLPPDPVIPLGVQEIAPGQSLQLVAQSGPGLQTGLVARPVPVALAEGPLFLTQAPGDPAITVPVTLAAGGTLSVRELGGADVAVADAAGAGGAHTLTLPATDRPRTVVLAWRRTVTRPDIPAPPAEASVPTVVPGRDLPFDLAQDERRGFALAVAEGGLYRVETSGRLHTSGRLASAFVPELGRAEANGAGENMLLQNWLRAGRYRVDVKATGSAGHLAIRAEPAPLQAGPALEPGSSVRATMAAGSGVAFPVEIGEDGRYHLDLLALGTPFTVRLDDAEGWPVTVPGAATALDLTLRRGTYRLLVSPEPVERRVVARLGRVVEPAPTVGHGPHPLPFGAAQEATWREPPGRDEARTPDVWTFALAGPAQTRLALADGMFGELRQGERTVARFTRRWSGKLEAGAYRLEATSLGRNDRLDYTVKLEADEIQPGQTRSVTLPATIPFALATPRIVTLTSWGSVPVKGVLRRQDGSEVTRVGARRDDWNIALSRPLAAGAYRLELAASVPPSGASTTPQDPGAAAASDTTDDTTTSDKGADDAEANADSASADDQTPQSPPAKNSEDAAQASEDDKADASVEVRFALPDEGAIAVQPIAAAEPGRLIVAQAAGAGAAGLTLERQGAEGWSVVALDQGAAPFVAALADGSGAAWRARAWPIDGTRPVSLRTAALNTRAQPPGQVALTKPEGFDLFAAHVAVESAGILDVGGAWAAAGWPGHAAARIEDRQAVVQDGKDLWLLARAAGPVIVRPMRLDTALTVTVPDGGTVPLPSLAASPGRLHLWRAEAGAGQPVFVGGAHPVAPHSAIASASAALGLRAGETGQDLPVRLTPLDLAVLPEAAPGSTTLPAMSALPVRLPGAGRVALALAAGTGAVSDAGGAWAGDAPLARDLFADGVVVLVNTNATPAPVTLRWTEAPPTPPLTPGRVEKRFFGAAGSFDLPVNGAGVVAVAGDATLDLQTADGRLHRGQKIAADGSGVLTVTHGTGPVVVSMAAPDISPWPQAAPQDTPIPAEVALQGPAMALAIAPEGPVLLHATTTAPVLLGLGDRAPELFAAGAEFHRAIPAGPATLRLYSPHDGPLAGTLTLAAEPIRPAREGVGDSVAVAPGESAAFGFTLSRKATVGVGVRAEPDRAEVRLLDASGAVLGEGVAQLQSLAAGRYVLEVRVPPDAPTTLIRPALVGISPRGNGPPPEIVQHYLELVGLTPVEPGK